MQKRVFFDENEKSGFKPYHKVRDQCHYTGKFIGAAHSICNLRYKVPKEIPIVIHNCSTYDLLIALDLCQPYYHTLLLIYQKFTKKSKVCMERKMLNQNVILLVLKIIHYVKNVKTVKRYG